MKKSAPIITKFEGLSNSTTAFLLRQAGIEGALEHEIPHSEEEIRALLLHAHIAGELSRSEHRLINAVFEFDDEQPQIIQNCPDTSRTLKRLSRVVAAIAA